jgi:uncharacterized OsmC-like protein
MTDQTMLNGIDVNALRSVIGSVKENASLGKSEFRATNEWISGTHCRAHVKGFYSLGEEDTTRKDIFSYDMDEPPALTGHNMGSNPTEMALVALSGCLTTTLIVYAAAKGYKLDSVHSHLSGDLDLHGFFGLDEQMRRGYDNVNVTFDIQGDLTDQQKQELIELAQRYSPVFDIVSNPVPVHVGLASEPTQAEAA